MKKTGQAIAFAMAITLGGATGAALAQTRTAKPTNPNNLPPGQMMNEKGRTTHGASSYTPGHEMKTLGSVKGTSGASGYAPGHAPSGRR